MKQVRLTTNLGSLEYPGLLGREGEEIEAMDAVVERLIANGHAVLIARIEPAPAAVVQSEEVIPATVPANIETKPANVEVMPAKHEPESVAVVAAAEMPDPRPVYKIGRKAKEN